MGLEIAPAMTSSNSFRVDHREEITSAEMVNDVRSYLYEFRLRAQKYDYDLSLLDGKLADPIRNEPMATKAYRALIDHKSRGEPAHREEAELTGITSLEQQLGQAQVGDSLIWFSPQGPEAEGYTNEYAFGFTGRIVEETASGKTIRMTANRFERPTLDAYRQAFFELTGAQFEAQNADDFIRMPMVFRGGISDEYVEMVFAKNFGFVYDSEQARIKDLIYETQIRHLAHEYSRNFHIMSTSERVRAIHAMENITSEKVKMAEGAFPIAFYHERQDLHQAMIDYDYEPEEVKGSCPVTKSNNPFSKFEASTIEDIINGEKCNACGRSREDNHYHCPDCKKTYSDETSKSAYERTKQCSCGFKFGC